MKINTIFGWWILIGTSLLFAGIVYLLLPDIKYWTFIGGGVTHLLLNAYLNWLTKKLNL